MIGNALRELSFLGFIGLLTVLYALGYAIATLLEWSWGIAAWKSSIDYNIQRIGQLEKQLTRRVRPNPDCGPCMLGWDGMYSESVLTILENRIEKLEAANKPKTKGDK